MAETFGLVYRSLLTVEDLPLAIQERIYTYGLKSKDYELLAALARHERLDPSLDSRFSEVPHGVVKAAWASRPERTDADLSALVMNEKRVKVLTALASREDTPLKVFTLIAECEGQAPLAALAMNEVVPFDTRVAAVARLASRIGSTAKTLPKSVLSLVSSDDRFAEAAAKTTKNPYIAMAALQSGAVDGSVQTRAVGVIVDGLSQRVTEALARNMQAYYVELYNLRDYIGEATTALQASGVNKESADLVESVRELLGAFVEQHPRYASDVNDLYATADSTESTAMVVKARTAPDEATLRSIVLQMASSSSRSDNHGPTLCAVAQNPHCTPEIIRTMISNHLAHWNVVRSMTAAVTNQNSLAAILLHAPWVGIDSVLGRQSDPVGVLANVFRIANEIGSTPAQEFIMSKYMNPSLIETLPIGAFFPNNATPALTTKLVEMLTERVSDPATWEVLETVGKNFTGSVDDLLNIAATV